MLRRRRLLPYFFTPIVSFLVGCVPFMDAPVVPPQGIVISQYSAPLSINGGLDLSKDRLRRSSRSTKYFREPILTGWSFAWEEAMIGQIAAEGGISEIQYADYSYLSVLGIYAELEVSVYGYE